jgi:Fic family protein
VVNSLIEEAIASSQLEGAATTRRVAKEMIRSGRPPADRSEQMILNNFKTMQRIGKIKDLPLTKELVFEIQRTVTENTLDDSSESGSFRNDGNKVVVGDMYNEVFHTPPLAGQLEARMEAMCEFANDNSSKQFIHPVIRSIILHFWLAYDHPFADGNGRTARALFYWSMLKHGYWLFEFISISQVILNAPAKYGKAFLYTETDDNDLTYFILYHLEVIEKAIDQLHDYIERKTRRLKEVEQQIHGLEKFNYRQRTIIAHALRHPNYRYTVKSHQFSHNIVYQTARTDLLNLHELGLLTLHKPGKAHYFSPVADLEARLAGLSD